MKGDVLLQNIRIGFIPASTGKKAKESRLFIREAILTKLGKNIENVKKRCSGKPLSINIVFLLHKATYTKKSLEVLADSIIKILGEEMSSKKESIKGLEIVSDPTLIHRVVLEKKMLDKSEKEEFSFSIYEWD